MTGLLMALCALVEVFGAAGIVVGLGLLIATAAGTRGGIQ